MFAVVEVVSLQDVPAHFLAVRACDEGLGAASALVAGRYFCEVFISEGSALLAGRDFGTGFG